MGSEQAREAAAQFFGFPAWKYAETSTAKHSVEKLAELLTTAREQALREAAEIARTPHTGGEQCFRAAWDQVGQSIADRILSLLTKEPKA